MFPLQKDLGKQKCTGHYTKIDICIVSIEKTHTRSKIDIYITSIIEIMQVEV